MGKLNIERCPETGICSIIKADGTKVDLMPGEVADVQAASGDAAAIKTAVSEADEKFAEALSAEEIAEIAGTLKQ